MGETVVAPFLWRIGTRSVDRLLITHAHFDHVGGAPYLTRVFSIKETWEGPAPQDDPDYVAISQALVQERVARRGVCRGSSEKWDDISLDVVWPPCRRIMSRTVQNDHSIVLRLMYDKIAFLLTGDVESTAERSMALERVDVVKVPHHGSLTSSSSAFVEALDPRIAIVSVGRGQWRGHPNREVLQRYERRGARIYRTDRDGAVTVSTDGKRIWIRTHKRDRNDPAS
jgi:competence protein ComEC